MKNRYISLVLAASLFLSGCSLSNVPTSSASSEESTVESSSEETTTDNTETEKETSASESAEESSASSETEESTESTSETSEDPEEKYKSVYASQISDIKEFMESGDDYNEKLPIGLNEIRNQEDPQVGYKIMDINKDDIPELLIGDGKVVVGLYSVINGSPKLIFDGSARNTYGITVDGKIINYGSGGAIYSVFGTYTFDPVNVEIKCEDYYFSYEVEDGNYDKIGYYHNTNGTQDKSKS